MNILELDLTTVKSHKDNFGEIWESMDFQVSQHEFTYDLYNNGMLITQEYKPSELVKMNFEEVINN